MNNAPSAILAKARAWHDSTAANFEQSRDVMRESTQRGLERRDFSSVALSVSGFSGTCLELGMGWFKLDNAPDRARATFSCAAEIIPIVEEVERRIGTVNAILARPRWNTGRCFGPVALLQPMLCLALAGDRERTGRIAEFHRNPAMRQDDEKAAFNVFAQHLSASVRDEPEVVRMEDYDIDPDPRLYIERYKVPLFQLIRDDQDAIRDAIPGWDAGFHARARMRKPDPMYGASPLGQALAFDALATAIVRIANWRGADILPHTESVPAAFCVD